MVTRGQIWWVDFAEPIGSAPGYRRPAVIVSSDRFNASRIRTVLVVAVTSNLRLASAPGNVLLPDGLLPKSSVANVSQLLAIDRSRLDGWLADTPLLEMQAVDRGLRLALGL